MLWTKTSLLQCFTSGNTDHLYPCILPNTFPIDTWSPLQFPDCPAVVYRSYRSIPNSLLPDREFPSPRRVAQSFFPRIVPTLFLELFFLRAFLQAQSKYRPSGMDRLGRFPSYLSSFPLGLDFAGAFSTSFFPFNRIFLVSPP